MRTIQVSADLYAAIWKRHEPGEATEEEILRRVLEVPAREHSSASGASSEMGFYDRRNGLHFPTGFEIFRAYLGREYRAQAIGGLWRRADNGQDYPSLNRLSASIGASENAWDAWLYLTEAGETKPVATLRDPTKIRRRTPRSLTSKLSAEELGL